MKTQLPRNTLATLSRAETLAKYKVDSKHSDIFAYDEDGITYKLRTINPERLEFIGGLWRVQRLFDKEVIKIHEIEKKKTSYFVLLGQMDIVEPNNFKYFRAAGVNSNCYGWQEGEPNYVLAQYKVFGHNHWSYQSKPDAARAFLGNRMNYIFQDAINLIASAHGDLEKEKLINEMFVKLGAPTNIMADMQWRSEKKSK